MSQGPTPTGGMASLALYGCLAIVLLWIGALVLGCHLAGLF